MSTKSWIESDRTYLLIHGRRFTSSSRWNVFFSFDRLGRLKNHPGWEMKCTQESKSRWAPFNSPWITMAWITENHHRHPFCNIISKSERCNKIRLFPSILSQFKSPRPLGKSEQGKCVGKTLHSFNTFCQCALEQGTESPNLLRPPLEDCGCTGQLLVQTQLWTWHRV